jgi:serine protease inhibitor ecotin
MEQITQDSLTTSSWRNFYDTLKNNVTSVTVTGIGAVTIQSYVASYTDKMLDSKTSYPILIVNSPEFSFNPLTFRSKETEARIEVEILCNQAVTADLFKDRIQKVIRDNESTLRGYGMDEVELDDTASAFYTRGNINVHSRKLVWRFKFAF